MRSLLKHISPQDPLAVLGKVLDAWDLLGRFRDKVRYHGMYEILDYDATLEICDSKGKKAVLTRREVIRFLQDNVVAVQTMPGATAIFSPATAANRECRWTSTRTAQDTTCSFL